MDPRKRVIRHAELSDLPVCEELYSTARGGLAHKIESSEVIVAEEDGVVCGCLVLTFIWPTLPYMNLIRVRAGFRNRGVGTAMLKHTEEWLRSLDHEVLLSSSQVDESEPQDWHRKRGFTECGILTSVNSGKVGEVFFRKELR